MNSPNDRPRLPPSGRPERQRPRPPLGDLSVVVRNDGALARLAEEAAAPAVVDPDWAALARVASFRGMARPACGDDQLGSEPLPVLDPIGEPTGHLAFDRAVCSAGLRAFIRPRFPDDWPDIEGRAQPIETHTFVREVKAGFRIRRPVCYSPAHELN